MSFRRGREVRRVEGLEGGRDELETREGVRN